MSNSDGTKRRRHVPVRNASHVYKSRRADGSWVYEVRHPANAEGKRPFEVVGTRLDAAKARAREIHSGAAPIPLSVATTFADVLADWRATRDMRPQTIETFERVLRLRVEPYFNRKKVRDITPGMIQAWLAGMKRLDGKPGELSGASKRQALTVLNLVLQHAVDNGKLGSVPRLPRKRKPNVGESRKRILSLEEERNLLAYCGAFPWMRGVITVALHQALRLGEVVGLQWADVDFAAGKLHVRRQLLRNGTFDLPKGGKAATIPLTPAARAVLLDLLQDADGGGQIFTGTYGGPRDMRLIQRNFQLAVQRAALQVTEDGGVCFHSLRHTSISRLANDPRIPLIAVRDFARHSKLATTELYIHKVEDETMTLAIGEALIGGAA